jgi:hypothetical protein
MLMKDTNLHTVHKTKHRLLRTTATTPSAEHHMKTYNLYSWRWAYKFPKHVEIFVIINHNCCIKLVPLVIIILYAGWQAHATTIFLNYCWRVLKYKYKVAHDRFLSQSPVFLSNIFLKFEISNFESFRKWLNKIRVRWIDRRK